MTGKWLREPLVHFLVAGFLLFLVLGSSAADPASRTIKVDEARVAQLAESFAQSWQRPPQPREINGLIRDYIKTEIYEREARRMGLDIDDEIIRRRLRSKMEFLVDSQVESLSADDATLQAWLDRHPMRYATRTLYSFEQIYLGESGTGAAELAQLARGADPGTLGKPLSLSRTIASADGVMIAREFGETFATALSGLQPGHWSGPVPSGFGVHLVRIGKRIAGRKPALSEVRQQVENDWRTETRRAREAAAFQALLDGYTIRIDRPQ